MTERKTGKTKKGREQARGQLAGRENKNKNLRCSNLHYHIGRTNMHMLNTYRIHVQRCPPARPLAGHIHAHSHTHTHTLTTIVHDPRDHIVSLCIPCTAHSSDSCTIEHRENNARRDNVQHRGCLPAAPLLGCCMAWVAPQQQKCVKQYIYLISLYYLL
jgi:hypothetical protein